MFLRKKLFSRKFQVRGLLLGISICMAAQPFMTVAQDITPEQQQQMMHYLQQMMRQSTANQSQDAITALAMGQLPCVQDIQPIIGRNELDELQIVSLIRAIDTTKTTFGSNALKQSICPVSNMESIAKRQNQVRALLEDEKLFQSVERQLERVKRAQDSVLKYWDDAQYENSANLFFQSRSLYFTWLSKLFGDRINQTKLSLEISHAIEATNIGLRLIALIGLEGVKWELTEWMFSDKGDLNLARAFKDGFRGSFNIFNPFETEKYVPDGHGFRRALTSGSWQDVFHALYNNYDATSTIRCGFVGKGLKKVPYLDSKFDDEGRYLSKNTTMEENAKLVKKIGWGSFAGAGTAVVMGWRAKGLYDEVKSTGQRVISFTKTMKQLHVHTVHLARAMDAMQKLAAIVREHEVLSKSCFAQHMQETIEHPSASMEKLLDVLKKDTFTLKKAKSQLFSRGNVLLAHRAFGSAKDEISLLLQAIGELDAVYAMARNMKEHKDSKTPYCFAEFVPGVQAMIDVEQAWLPMIKQPVANTITLGGESHPNKVIITGPNGGGKSVFLKMLGCIVVLAQSWGIVPAKRARISLFDGVRTCIHPQESLEHELSTFMAEKMRIDAIKQYVFQNNTPGFKTLLLLDEPFKGTVDSESADRIYDFGKEIAQLKGLLVGIATHVEKPITLAQETGAYANYHVRINELENGRFEREFTLEPGVLRWWFDDAIKRSKFIDFVTLEKHKEQLEHQKQDA